MKPELDFIYYGFLTLSSVLGWIIYRITSFESAITSKTDESKVLMLIDLKQQPLIDKHVELTSDLTALRHSIEILTEKIHALTIQLVKKESSSSENQS